MRVLLATDRCFVPQTDGTSRLYGLWLRALVELGADVTVLSFDHGRMRWSAEARAAVQAQAVLHVVPFVRGRAEAALRRAAVHLHQIATGRHHPPAPLARPWSAAARRELVARLGATRWDAVVVQNLHTAGMIGFDLLHGLGCPLTVFQHDSMPLRRFLIHAAVRRALARRTWPLLRALQPQEAATALLPGRVAAGIAEEVALLRGFDHVLFASAEEQAAYEAAGLAAARCHVHVTASAIEPPPPAAAPACDLGFIGGVNIFNLEALAFLARDILPRLDRRLGRPASVLLGGGSATVMQRLFAGRTLVAEPRVRDMAGFYARAAVVAVPMLSGSGVSTKAIEAAGFGGAMVSTTVGMRGAALRPGTEFELADDPEAFAAAAATLLADPARRAALGRHARAAFVERHSLDCFAAQVAQLIGLPSPPAALRAPQRAALG